MPLVRDIIEIIESFAPSFYQESYDNSGLQLGDPEMEVTGVLLSVDITEEVIDEAVSLGFNLIVSHHPLIFGNLKRITNSNAVERIIAKVIKAEIAVFSCHTNIDNVWGGVSFKMAEKLGLKDIKILKPLSGTLIKLVTFVPKDYADKVREAIFNAGAGHIGNYDCCSFNLSGDGTFRASENSNPFVGEKGVLHSEQEVRIETVLPKFIESKVISAMIKAHPYEEVAYDLYPLSNKQMNAGSGAIGIFDTPMDEKSFVNHVKEIFHISVVRHTCFLNQDIKKVALCGGSGSSFMTDAKRAGADVFLSADFKYHQFFDAEKKILIADIGHFESEHYTLDIFYDLLIKKISNFAVRFTKVNTNPIIYS